MCITDNLKGLSICDCDLVTFEFCEISGICNLVEGMSVVSDGDSTPTKVEAQKNTSPAQTPSLQPRQDHECPTGLNTSPARAVDWVSGQDHLCSSVDSDLGDKLVPAVASSDGWCLSLLDGSLFIRNSTWSIGRYMVVTWIKISVGEKEFDVNHPGPSMPKTPSKALTGSSIFSKLKPITLKAPLA